MGPNTLTWWDSSEEWHATCSVCGVKFTRTETPCPVCSQFRLRYVREQHIVQSFQSSRTYIATVHFKCDHCGHKYKGLACPEKRDSVVPMSEISAFLSRQKFEYLTTSNIWAAAFFAAVVLLWQVGVPLFMLSLIALPAYPGFLMLTFIGRYIHYVYTRWPSMEWHRYTHG